MEINRNMDARSWLLLAVLSVLWGGSFFFVEVAVKELPMLSIVFLRVSIAAGVLWLIILSASIPVPRGMAAWLSLAGMGILNNVIPFTLIVWGQIHIESGLASILNATTPLFGVLIAGFLLIDERFSSQKLIGISFGFVGTVYMIGFTDLSSQGNTVLPQLAIIGAAISYGFASVFGRRFKVMGIHPITTAAGQVTSSALILLPLTLFIDQPWTLGMPSNATIGSIVALAVLCTSLAYIIYFQILSSSGAVNLLLVTFLIPVSAIVLGYLVLNERLSIQHYVGMGLIGIGLSIIDGRLWSRFKRPISI
jgi:drug/metabolite transporter (DMT)-like permease